MPETIGLSLAPRGWPDEGRIGLTMDWELSGRPQSDHRRRFPTVGNEHGRFGEFVAPMLSLTGGGRFTRDLRTRSRDAYKVCRRGGELVAISLPWPNRNRIISGGRGGPRRRTNEGIHAGGRRCGSSDADGFRLCFLAQRAAPKARPIGRASGISRRLGRIPEKGPRAAPLDPQNRVEEMASGGFLKGRGLAWRRSPSRSKMHMPNFHLLMRSYVCRDGTVLYRATAANGAGWDGVEMGKQAA